MIEMSDDDRQEVNKDFYESYVSKFKSNTDKFDEDKYIFWSKVTSSRLKGWLPTDKSSKILDAGCGPGNLLHMFNYLGFKNFEGIDISEEQISIARKITPEVHLGDIFDFLAKKIDSYNLITAFDLLEHLEKGEAVKFLKLVRKALQNDGSLILHLPNASAPRGMHFQSSDMTHEQFYSPESVTQALNLCGYSDISFREVKPVSTGISIGSIPLNPKVWLNKLSWKLIRSAYRFRDYSEGYKQEIYTRNMLVVAKKIND